MDHFYKLYIDVLDNEIRDVLEEIIGKEALLKHYQEQLAIREVKSQEFIQTAQQKGINWKRLFLSFKKQTIETQLK